MRRQLLFFIAFVALIVARPSRAASIQLSLEGSGGSFSQTTPLFEFYLPPALPITLDTRLQGANASFQVGQIGSSSEVDGLAPGNNVTFPVVGNVYLYFQVPSSDPSHPDSLGQMSITIPVSGSIEGPHIGGSDRRWSGQISGTASSVTFDSTSSTAPDLSKLPPVLVDAINHPGHVGFLTFVAGGSQNLLQATLSFSAISPVPVPEPSVLLTLTVAASALALSRRMRGRHVNQGYRC
jgi:hypothetical protein